MPNREHLRTMGVTRYVNMSFVVIGLVSYIIFGEFIAWGLDFFGAGVNSALIGVNFRMADLLSLVVSLALVIYLRRDDRIYTYAMEVGNELSKVTWPTWKETKLSTVVVVIVTLIISIILAGFDYLWSAISSLVYNV